jgi:CelD/BcsL family acetyltransferase involved in cellulose biosynthesis
MLSYAWVKSFLEHRLNPGESWRCLFAYTRDELVGVLPLIGSKHLFGGTQLRGPSDPHTTRSGYALLAAGRAREVLSALLDALRDLEPDHLWVKFSGVRDCSPTLRASNQGIRRALVTSTTAERGSLIAVHGSFDAYASSLRPSFLRNLRKAGNRARRDHHVSFRFISGPDARDPELLDRFLAIEGSGWKGAAGTAIQCSPTLTAFYRALARRLADRGWLEWHFLDFDGTPVAAHVAVRFGRSLTIPKIGYDETHARSSPGNLLFWETVARAFADGCIDEVNCLTDMQWHANWRMTQAAYRDLRVYPRRVVPVLVGFIECELPVQVRALAKRVPALAMLVSKAPTQLRAREW